MRPGPRVVSPGTKSELGVRGAVLLLTICSSSDFGLYCLASKCFHFIIIIFMCV